MDLLTTFNNVLKEELKDKLRAFGNPYLTLCCSTIYWLHFDISFCTVNETMLYNVEMQCSLRQTETNTCYFQNPWDLPPHIKARFSLGRFLVFYWPPFTGRRVAAPCHHATRPSWILTCPCHSAVFHCSKVFIKYSSGPGCFNPV